MSEHRTYLNLVHILWSKAVETPGYYKPEWKALKAFVISRKGVSEPVPEGTINPNWGAPVPPQPAQDTVVEDSVLVLFERIRGLTDRAQRAEEQVKLLQERGEKREMEMAKRFLDAKSQEDVASTGLSRENWDQQEKERCEFWKEVHGETVLPRAYPGPRFPWTRMSQPTLAQTVVVMQQQVERLRLENTQLNNALTEARKERDEAKEMAGMSAEVVENQRAKIIALTSAIDHQENAAPVVPDSYGEVKAFTDEVLLNSFIAARLSTQGGLRFEDESARAMRIELLNRLAGKRAPWAGADTALQLQKEHDAARKAWNALKSQMEDEAEEREAEVTELKKKVGEWFAQVQKLSAEVKELKSRCDWLDRDNNALTAKLSSQDAAAAEYVKGLIKSHNDACYKKNRRIDELAAERDALHAKGIEMEDELRARIVATSKRAVNACMRATDWQDKYDALESKYRVTHARAQKLDAEKSEWAAGSASLQAQVKELGLMRGAVKAQVKELEDKCGVEAELRVQVKYLKEERDSAREAHSACAGEVEDLKREIKEWAAGSASLQAQVKNLVKIGAESLHREGLIQAEKNAVYAERNRVVAALAHVADMLDSTTAWAVVGRDEKAEEGFQTVLFMDLGGGQMSWHIKDDALPLLARIPPASAHDTVWDGHTTEEKYKRLEAGVAKLRKGLSLRGQS